MTTKHSFSLGWGVLLLVFDVSKSSYCDCLCNSWIGVSCCAVLRIACHNQIVLNSAQLI